MESLTQIQIQDEDVCVLLSTHILKKEMNPSLLPQAMGKLQGKLGVVSYD